MTTISASRDRKWIVCGTTEGASVWDAELQEKVVEVDPGMFISALDVSPDSTRFATGTWAGDKKASIWSITTGERLVGPLEHDGSVYGIKFSPDGGHFATACMGNQPRKCIRIFDSHNGDQLITIENPQFPNWASAPIVWASDGQLFAISTAGKIQSFDTSTGSRLAEWQIHDEDNLMSIALSANNKFIACSAGRSVSFWDTSTHTQLGIVEDAYNIRSLALSPDSSQLVAGNSNNVEGITIWDLSGILPETYLPINTQNVVDQQPDGSHSDPPDLAADNRDNDDALLEVELPEKTSAPLFNYDEPPSPPAESRGNPGRAPGSSEAKPHAPLSLPMITTVEVPDAKPNPDHAESSKANQRRNIGGWFKTMMKGGSHKRTPHQTPSEESHQDSTSPSNEKPSTITLGKRVQRTVGRSTVRPPKKAAQKHAASSQPPKPTPRSEAGPDNVPDDTKAESSGAAQTDLKGVPEGPSSHNLNVSLSFSIPIPSWLWCGGTH
ncbi:YVTN repeat-like/Quino protein amine dehydrogenase [Imleria badia]|nr:YVTN repeat-like/Quino protein amine dehydrogenase [Imleria badia]